MDGMSTESDGVAWWVYAVVLVLAAVMFTVVLVACGTEKNATINSRDTQGAQVVNMPEGWASVATRCYGHGLRLFVTDHTSGGSAVAVVNDPTCN